MAFEDGTYENEMIENAFKYAEENGLIIKVNFEDGQFEVNTESVPIKFTDSKEEFDSLMFHYTTCDRFGNEIYGEFISIEFKRIEE
jgi:hypothetical protein